MRWLVVGVLCLFSFSGCERCSSKPTGSRQPSGIDAAALENAPKLEPLPALKKAIVTRTGEDGAVTKARVMLPTIAPQDALTVVVRLEPAAERNAEPQDAGATPDRPATDGSAASPEDARAKGASTTDTDTGDATDAGDAAASDAAAARFGALATLTLHVVPPSGSEQVWRVSAETESNQVPALSGREHTLRFTGKGVELLRMKRFAGWRDPPGKLFATAGKHSVRIEGILRLPSGPARFRTAPLTVEVDPAVQPLAAIERVAKAAAHKWVPSREGPHRLKPVMEDEAKNRVVRFSIGESYQVAFTEVVVSPGGEVLSVEASEVFTCVAEGTLVATPHGPVEVERLRVGDAVTSYDLEAGRAVTTRVRAIFPARARALVELGPELRVTPTHPVWAGGAWVTAGKLAPGSELLALDGHTRRVTPSPLGTSARVYDLSVDPPHNFFAGGLLVHNKMAESPGGSAMRHADWEHLDVRPGAKR